MIINPPTIDAYIARKGLLSRLDDMEWKTVLDHLAATLGRNLWHRCRLVHQADDPLRRHSTDFPDAVPQPYRYIYYLEFVVFESERLRELQKWLTERCVMWQEIRQFDIDTGKDEINALRIYGYDH